MVIFTKYMPRVNLPARIQATTPARKQMVYVDYDPDKSLQANHQAAVERLCKKLYWADMHFAIGVLPSGYCYVSCDAVGKHTHTSNPPLPPLSHVNGQAPSVNIKPSPVEEPTEDQREALQNAAEVEAFRRSMLKVGVLPDVIDRLLALGRDGMYAQYKAGSLRFATPTIQMAFVEALKSWHATTAPTPAPQEDAHE